MGFVSVNGAALRYWIIAIEADRDYRRKYSAMVRTLWVTDLDTVLCCTNDRLISILIAYILAANSLLYTKRCWWLIGKSKHEKVRATYTPRCRLVPFSDRGELVPISVHDHNDCNFDERMHH